MNVKLKNSFKMTELGLIPGDWEVKRLGDVAEINMGKTPSRSVKTFWGKGYLWVSIADLKEKFIFETKEEITELGALKMQIIPKGTLVMSFKLSIGKLAFVGNDMYSNEAICNFQKPKACSDYLYYILSRTDFSRYGKQAVKGYTLNTVSLKSIQIPIPPLPEQKAIAEVLSDVDELIAALDKLITKKQNIKQAAMQDLLTGKIRLPGFGVNNNSFKMTELGLIPRDWEVKALGDVAELNMGKTPSRSVKTFWGNGYSWLSIADLKEKFIFETKEEITELGALKMQIIPKGTLVMSFKLSIGKLAFVGNDMYSNEAICNFQKPKVCSDYLYYILSRTDFSQYGKQAVKGYTLNTVSLKSIKILTPPLPEQKAIAEVLTDMDNEIMALQKRRDKIKLVKKGLMQELLTGRIRLV